MEAGHRPRAPAPFLWTTSGLPAALSAMAAGIQPGRRMGNPPVAPTSASGTLLRGRVSILVVCIALTQVSIAEIGRVGPSDGRGDPGQVLDFDTARISGTIRLEGAYHGVTRLVDKESGRQLIDPRYAALNLFKLMSVNLVMGQPRNMNRVCVVGTNFAEIRWPPTEMHRCEMVARYDVRDVGAIDLTVTVRSLAAYQHYELFLSSYLDRTLEPLVYLKSRNSGAGDLIQPTVNDVFRGCVLVFPRDANTAKHCLDGRWERNEGGVPVVQMCPVRHYAHCLAILADPGRTRAVLLMADPRDCYAISTRYHAAADADRLTTYSAFDFSMFGCDLAPGDERRVRVRLAVTDADKDFSQPLKTYRAFLEEGRR